MLLKWPLQHILFDLFISLFILGKNLFTITIKCKYYTIFKYKTWKPQRRAGSVKNQIHLSFIHKKREWVFVRAKWVFHAWYVVPLEVFFWISYFYIHSTEFQTWSMSTFTFTLFSACSYKCDLSSQPEWSIMRFEILLSTSPVYVASQMILQHWPLTINSCFFFASFIFGVKFWSYLRSSVDNFPGVIYCYDRFQSVR